MFHVTMHGRQLFDMLAARCQPSRITTIRGLRCWNLTSQLFLLALAHASYSLQACSPLPPQHFKLPITGTLTTYMEPGDAKTGHSKSFSDTDVPRLWSQPPPAFFARKFLPTPRNDNALAARLKQSIANNHA